MAIRLVATAERYDFGVADYRPDRDRSRMLLYRCVAIQGKFVPTAYRVINRDAQSGFQSQQGIANASCVQCASSARRSSDRNRETSNRL